MQSTDLSYFRYSGKGWLASSIKAMASWGWFRARAGHYYSPIPSRKDVLNDSERIFDKSLRNLPGVDLNIEEQLAFLESLVEFYPDMPFTAKPSKNMRFYFNNPFYGYTDAILYSCILRLLKPQRVYEIGSGFSSFVALDTSRNFLNNEVRFKFIDPEPGRLKSRLKREDYINSQVIERRVQDVDINIFRDLGANDILFVDSSHVTKAGSDLNHIVFEILPLLAPGVYVHFHDVHYPFEYPFEVVYSGISWNEAYLLRAFLEYNHQFKVRLWNDFILKFHSEWLRQWMPLAAIPTIIGVDGSLWLQRVEGDHA